MQGIESYFGFLLLMFAIFKFESYLDKIFEMRMKDNVVRVLHEGMWIYLELDLQSKTNINIKVQDQKMCYYHQPFVIQNMSVQNRNLI